MISAILLADVSAHGWPAVASILLLAGGIALLAPMAYATLGALRLAHADQEQKLSQCGLTGREAAAQFLEHIGLASVCIEEGAKIDHYDHLHRRVRLRAESCVSSSVAALAIAAHEVGHAEQYATGYWAASATRDLLVLLVLGASVVFIYPFAITIAGAGDVDLTSLLALFAVVAVLRLPVTIALERDASRRALRLLGEANLTHQTEQEGIARMLQAAFRAHVVLSVALVVAIGAGVATMWLVENGLGTRALTDVQGGLGSESEPGVLPRTQATEGGEGYAYPLAAFLVAVATVCWAFWGGTRKSPVCTELDTHVP
jgi:uncharacterized protein